MRSAHVLPRHGVSLVRLTLVPPVRGAERLAWIAAREWPLAGAIAALLVLIGLAGRVPTGNLDPALVAGYLAGFAVTRLAARTARRAMVRLEVVIAGR